MSEPGRGFGASATDASLGPSTLSPCASLCSGPFSRSHAGQASIKRLEDAYENLRLIHLPVDASWLNQIEIYFSILQRKALTPTDFDSLDALAERIVGFQAHWQQAAEPFDRNFTRRDLDQLMARLAQRDSQLRLVA